MVARLRGQETTVAQVGGQVSGSVDVVGAELVVGRVHEVTQTPTAQTAGSGTSVETTMTLSLNSSSAATENKLRNRITR